MGIGFSLDLTSLQDFQKCLDLAPRVLFRELATAFQSIGRYDIDRIRGNVSGSLKLVSQGAAKSFKFKSTDKGKATDFSKLFTSEYTGWKAANIFQTGGTITGKGKNLTVLEEAGRRLSGKRKFTQSQLRNMVASGKVRFVPTPRGVLLVQSIGKLTKKGTFSHNARDIILAVLRKSITEKKRINFYETSEGASSIHNEYLEYAIENTLATIAAEANQGE